ncbi:peptidase C25 [Bacteroidia bacterium]|nr:peptidase C25 [Bacteroidia bacterium]
MKKYIAIVSILGLLWGYPSALFADNSVLGAGRWVQLKVYDNAVYKLTFEEIQKMGFADPAQVKIYGYGGWLLDADFTKPAFDDLPEVAVYLHKGSDNVFNAGDYLLFYGRGVQKWAYNASTDAFEHENNPYSTFGSYFITENAAGPKEMTVQASGTPSGNTAQTFDDYALHEKEQTAIINSGRELFGESFAGNPTQTFPFTVPGIAQDVAKVCLSFAAKPSQATPVTVSVGDATFSQTVNPTSSEYEKAKLVNATKDWTGAKSENISVKVSYNSTGISFLNYIRLNVTRNLRFYGDACTFFRNKAARNTALNYVIANAPATGQVWNVTDPVNCTLLESLTFSSGTPDGTIPEYALVDLSKPFPTPEIAGEIPNQNLHALPQTDMVIIVPAVYASQAEQLAAKHREKQNLHVTVVQPEWIYNEFSSGTPDATAYRRFMKMFYDRATTAAEKPRYLLLYGDGLFDNRHLTAAAKMDARNYLLTYQFKESVNETYSYGTDDYFGFLDNNEGLNLNSDKLDLGIGRLPVSSVEQAENVLQKLLTYMDNTHHGRWKNTLLFTADDIDENGGTTDFVHVRQADDLAKYIESNHPQYMVNRAYMDAIQPMFVNGKTVYPDAKQKLQNTLKEGCFLVNYTGHGATHSISGQDFLNISDVNQMTFETLPLWITATCDFGWFDAIQSPAGEDIMLRKKSGGIALITTSRVVYSSPNFVINDKLIRRLFMKIDGKYPALGDVMRLGKLDVGTDGNKLNYNLLGDPALQLNYPEWQVKLETINSEDIVADSTYNFKALERMTLTGSIVDETGTPLPHFTGNLQATVFDGQQQFTSRTYYNDAARDTSVRFQFTDYSNTVYKGSSKVENGQFAVAFNVPLDISYSNLAGKINFYAFDAAQNSDANGAFLKYTLSGTADRLLNDIAPEISQMYLNTPDFRDGDRVNETPFFVAEVFDEDGINITGSGLGHDLTICIDNNPAQTYNLNNYYQPLDDRGGTVGFSIPTLAAGRHELAFRAWDILNNSTSESLRFTVEKGQAPELYTLVAYPNPVRDNTTFRIEHNRPESVLNVEMRVYDLTGRLIWSHSESGATQHSYPVEWDLTTNTGRKAPAGIYLYQATIHTKDGKETSRAKKIVIL